MPECEPDPVLEFQPKWLHEAIPFSQQNVPSRCWRYANHYNISERTNEDQCTSDFFNKQDKIRCKEFVHETDEWNIANEVQEQS